MGSSGIDAEADGFGRAGVLAVGSDVCDDLGSVTCFPLIGHKNQVGPSGLLVISMRAHLVVVKRNCPVRLETKIIIRLRQVRFQRIKRLCPVDDSIDTAARQAPETDLGTQRSTVEDSKGAGKSLRAFEVAFRYTNAVEKSSIKNH